MPLFLTDEEFQRCSHDPSFVAEKADAFIRELYNQLETVKAQADAASITAEQTCSLLEQKYVALSSEFSALQSQHSQLNSTLDQRLSELNQLQADNQQIRLLSIGKDGEIERLSTENSELHKSKRQLMEMLENKDLEISEKNATIKSYLDKIVALSDNAASREARLTQLESELARSQASCSQLMQEKELIERHNAWINDELTTKVNDLINLRKTHSELEADMSVKISDLERKFSESSSSLAWYKDRVQEMESKIASLEQELLSAKDSATRTEEQLSCEISTLNKLVELYKQSSEEWSKKAGELEGVIKALEAHSKQIETDYKEKLETEDSARKELEKVVASLKEKLATCETELERSKGEGKIMSLSSFSIPSAVHSVPSSEMIEDDRWLVPSIPSGVSGTALAASLLRDGWSLAKMYTKYQEAVDALHHEQLGRKQSQAILERVLYEIEEKAGIILDERAEHERLVEAYSALDEKLKHSLSGKATLENTIEELKADLRRCERDFAASQRENLDLQNQVTVLLKECRDIQLRWGSIEHNNGNETMAIAESDFDNAENLLSFKDISGLVEQNAQLRSLVRNLTYQIETRELELKDRFDKELKKQTDEAASKVKAVLARADEQGSMIESLHTSVSMYKKLYEEEHKLRTSDRKSSQDLTEDQRTEVMSLTELPQDALLRAQEQKLERLKCVEDELVKLRSEVISLRSERDKSVLEARFAKEKFDRFLKEFEHLREEHNAVLARNVEFSQLIVVYQKQMRDSSESCTAAEELSRKLKMEISILKHEKEALLSSEKRASDEVCRLTERVHRLQASLDTIQSTEEVREEARSAERRKQEEHIMRIEKEWAEAKKELQEERSNFRNLSLERDSACRQVEEKGKELANALHSLAKAETRAAVAEARVADLEERLRSLHSKVSDKADGSGPSSYSSETVADLCIAQEEIKNLREEVQVCKDHMLQYKSIAQANEEALKQMEVAHENFKIEADNTKKSLEEENLLLRRRTKELEGECDLRAKEVSSANAGKDEELSAAFAEIAHLKEECSIKISQIGIMEIQISSLKGDLEKEHQRWQAAQANYERQVILQSETIQELTKTSQALATLQQEMSELRKMSDALKDENVELKAKWEAEKSELEELKREADKKYSEVDEQNKILLSRLEAMHIKQAEKDRVCAGTSSGTATESDDGLQIVVNYLRRSKEIAETEISLLKQEKLRLKSQLENALKAVETAEASYRAEREHFKAPLFREEEFKDLQLQIRELNLLRESNLQLREENKHNFEECQKLREAAQKTMSEAEDLKKLLKDREHEVEACRKEVDIQKMEKQLLERRIDELLERCKSFDVEDYERVREAVRQMQATLKEKDDQLEEMRKHISEKQGLISKLEQDLARNIVELGQRESRINELLQAETALRSEVDKLKRSTNLQKKKFENLVKEKDELSKENQVLSKNLEEARQGRRNAGDAMTEQALKEKEKEKDTRIQMLEKTLERHREELKREKEGHKTEKARRLKTQKTCMESIDSVRQQQEKFLDELERHKQALKLLTDEADKLRQAKDSQFEGTSVDQLLAETPLADITAAYLQAVNNFERVVQPISLEGGTSTVTEISPGPDTSLSSGPTVSTVPVTSLSTPSTMTRTEDEREKRIPMSKINAETRKTGRKLVRPRILKPEEPHDDTEMQEVDASTSSGKHSVETQDSLMLASQPSAAHKRPSSEIQEETPTSEEASTDVQPVLKKAKGIETTQEGGEVKSVAPESGIANEEYDVGDLTHGFREEDDEKDEAGELQGEEVSVDTLNDRIDVVDDIVDRPSEEAVAIQEDQSNIQTQQDTAAATESGSEKEEGELVADIADAEGGSNLSIGSPESEQAATPENLTAVDEDPFANLTTETGEMDSSRVVDEEKTSDGVEELVEVQDKVKDGNEQVIAESDPVPESALATGTSTGDKPSISKEENPDIAAETEESKPPIATAKASTKINISERARQRAIERQGLHPTPQSSTPTTRGRGRVLRGRTVRGGRGGRGQTSG